MNFRIIFPLFVASASLSALAHPFSHEMPAETNESPLDLPYPEMAATFGSPFGKVETGCYWYWISGNVSAEGARKDIAAMKRIGIDRAYIGDISGGEDGVGPVKTLSPEWKAALNAAFDAASESGVEIGLFNSPGWSQSGGPWVSPEMAMRRFAFSLAVVDGPRDGATIAAPRFEGAPAEDARDFAVLAYPAPTGFSDRLERNGDEIRADDKGRLVVMLESDRPFLAQGAEIALADGSASGTVTVEAQAPSGWRKLAETPFHRTVQAQDITFAPHAPVPVAFPPATARKFRVTIAAKGAASYASVAVTGAPLVEMPWEKSLARMFESPLPMWNEYKWPAQPECAAGTALDPSRAIVLTDRLGDDGRLDWQVPTGRWVVARISVAPTGTKNAPANPEATGYETDKMSREHIAAHFDAYLGRILADASPSGRKTIRHAVLDSYEKGGQNYTDRFAEKFKSSFGYDPVPHLPAAAGLAVGGRAESDRFLWDLRRFVADEVAYSYVGGLRAAANAHGMKTWLECYGHWGFPGEFLQYGGQSDAVAGEFWSEGTLGDIENRAAASCAHTYGKRLVWSESNTCAGRPFARGPMDLKLRTDRFFAEGVNATILHLYIHQPDERAPGVMAWFGSEFNRHNTWFPHLDLYTAYLKRCGWMLRQGLNVADIAYFIGEDAPCMTGPVDPAPPPGRQFDFINAEVLNESASVDARGRIVLPHGTAYEVLVLPKLETMRPRTLATIERLVRAGALVIGPKPLRSPSLAGQPASDEEVKLIAARLWGEADDGKGAVSSKLSLADALASRGSAADAVTPPGIAFAHRTVAAAEIYFLANLSGAAVPLASVSFRVVGRVPELWNAANGEILAAEDWREENGRTIVNLSFARHESVFVVFPAAASKLPCGKDAGECSVVAVDGPWTATFAADGLHRGPKEPVVLNELTDLSRSADETLKFYSGPVSYRARFSLSDVGRHAVLDLGEVAVTAKVKVNGVYAGGVCFAPYRLDVSRFVRRGDNELEVEVCNLWVNRLAGDNGLDGRATWTSDTWTREKCYTRETPLPKSGLIGPVRIFVCR